MKDRLSLVRPSDPDADAKFWLQQILNKREKRKRQTVVIPQKPKVLAVQKENLDSVKLEVLALKFVLAVGSIDIAIDLLNQLRD